MNTRLPPSPFLEIGDQQDAHIQTATDVMAAMWNADMARADKEDRAAKPARKAKRARK